MLLASGDALDPGTIAQRIAEIFPEFSGCKGGVAPARSGKTLQRPDPVWMRVFYDSSRARDVLGVQFRAWDDTLRATVESLVDVGGVVPARSSGAHA